MASKKIRCCVCTHPSQPDLDAKLISKEITQTAAAELVGCGRRAIYRHLQDHVPADLLIQGVGEPKTLADALNLLSVKAEAILNEAIKKKDYELALKAMMRRESQIKLLGDITGEFQEKRPNEVAHRQKVLAFESAVETIIRKAKEQDIPTTVTQAIDELAQNVPEVMELLPASKFSSLYKRHDIIN